MRELEKNGLVVIEGALGGRALAAARADAAATRAERRPAINGGSDDDGGAAGATAAVRQDLVCWVRATDGTPAAPDPADRAWERGLSEDGLRHALRLLRGVAAALEARGYDRGGGMEGRGGAPPLRVPQQCQLGCYVGDGRSGYARHLDRCVAGVAKLGVLEVGGRWAVGGGTSVQRAAGSQHQWHIVRRARSPRTLARCARFLAQLVRSSVLSAVWSSVLESAVCGRLCSRACLGGCSRCVSPRLRHGAHRLRLAGFHALPR